ncbi:MAG: tetratricopeptide repeat protein, partial [Anaerolineales bacterium]|nr:tetratricopeptide repeat protein [Anaerolineales bacterium]
DSVASAIAAALGLNFAPGEPPKQQLVNYLRQQHVLLILDNFEPLLAAAGLLLNLLATAPQTAVLATSREPLKIQAERIFRLEGLALPEDAAWATAVHADSLQLFAERAERATGRNLLTPENLPQIVALCRFVNGLPLGIELMADWTRWLSLEAIAADLQSNLLHLARAPQDVPERHRSLQAVFNYSWQLLTPDERNTLAQLSVFQGSFQLDGVRAVTNSQPANLFALIDKSLVQHHGGDYYHLHELLRTFAQSKLAEQAIEPEALQDRHARHYLARMARRTPLFFGPEPQIALQQTQAETENVLKAWQWAVERLLPTDLFPAIPALGAYWNYTGLFREGDVLLQAARRRLADWPQLQAALAAEHATLLYELTSLDAMLAAAQTCIELALQVGDELLVAYGRFRLGQYFWRTGSYANAEKELAAAYQIAQRLGQANLAGMIARSQAANAWRQANLATAEQLALHSVELHQQANDIRSLSRTHYFLAILKKEQQALAESRTYAEPIVEVAQNIGDRLLEVSVIGFLGHIATYEGRYEQALAYLTRQRQLSEENGRLYDLASVLSNTGDLWLRLGQFERCAPFYQQSLELLRQLNIKQAQSNVLAHMGHLAGMQGEWENGRFLCEEALELAQAESAIREIAFAHIFLGHNLCGLGEWLAAQTAYEQALADWTKLGDTSRQLEAMAGQVRVLMALGKYAEAETAVALLHAQLPNHDLHGANDPVRLFLTCYGLALLVEGNSSATPWLQQGAAWLYKRADALTDPAIRETFLNAIPSHRALQRHRAALDKMDITPDQHSAPE